MYSSELRCTSWSSVKINTTFGRRVSGPGRGVAFIACWFGVAVVLTTAAANKAANKKLCLIFLVAAKFDCLVHFQLVFETPASSEIDIVSQKENAEQQPMTAKGVDMSPFRLVVLQDSLPRLRILRFIFA